ncbi:hypothetical protein QC823_15210 [Halomonas vilamensis]|uniref:DUF4351 domain-containing protein n=1 Tax=Vreelandella vilamensis TaxID=531309 RepID=A0ABU1H7N7_9GAMM|nr:hypothetical protein [Halomonas vilamensis]MDR5900316.1 hypothetical protein [Halomonas vilamensis]
MLAENLESWAKKEQMEGEQRGRLMEARYNLRAQLSFKFGEVPGWVESRVEQADHEQLKVWSRDILFASSLDEMFKQ